MRTLKYLIVIAGLATVPVGCGGETRKEGVSKTPSQGGSGGTPASGNAGRGASSGDAGSGGSGGTAAGGNVIPGELVPVPILDASLPEPPRVDAGVCEPKDLRCCYHTNPPVLCVGECSTGTQGKGCLGQSFPAAMKDGDEKFTICCGEGSEQKCMTNLCTAQGGPP